MRDGVQRTADRATPVTIFGRTYHLRGAEDPAYLSDLAAHLDHKMREVAEATGTPDTLKIAILAALNIADESLKSRRGRSGSSSNEGLERRLGQMVTMLDEALDG